MTKEQILAATGLDEASFYKKYPSKESFMKKFGGNINPFPQQPTEKMFFEEGYIPNSPVGFYKQGGQPCYECGGQHMEFGGQYGGVVEDNVDYFANGGWIQDATASIEKRGTEGVCTGDKFGGPGCPPGSKRYNLAKTFRAMAKKEFGGSTADGSDSDDILSKRKAEVISFASQGLLNSIGEEAADMFEAQYGAQVGQPMLNPLTQANQQIYQDSFNTLQEQKSNVGKDLYNSGMDWYAGTFAEGGAKDWWNYYGKDMKTQQGPMSVAPGFTTIPGSDKMYYEVPSNYLSANNQTKYNYAPRTRQQSGNWTPYNFEQLAKSFQPNQDYFTEVSAIKNRKGLGRMLWGNEPKEIQFRTYAKNSIPTAPTSIPKDFESQIAAISSGKSSFTIPSQAPEINEAMITDYERSQLAEKQYGGIPKAQAGMMTPMSSIPMLNVGLPMSNTEPFVQGPGSPVDWGMKNKKNIAGPQAAEFALAGMRGLTSLANMDDMRNMKEQMQLNTLADNQFLATQGNRGDYNWTGQSSGMFRPDQHVGVQQPGYAKYGGMHGFNSDQFPRPIPGQMSEPSISVRETLGSVPRSEANLEAEKGEVAVLSTESGIPSTYKIGGQRHSNGGTPLNLPDDSFIFSDTKDMRIKDKSILDQYYMGNKKSVTPATIASKYKNNVYKKLLLDKDEDDLAKNTAELMIANNNLKLGKLALLQESMKGFPQGIPQLAIPYIDALSIDPSQFIQQTPGGEAPQYEEADIAKYGGGFYQEGGIYKADPAMTDIVKYLREKEIKDENKKKEFLKAKENAELLKAKQAEEERIKEKQLQDQIYAKHKDYNIKNELKRKENNIHKLSQEIQTGKESFGIMSFPTSSNAVAKLNKELKEYNEFLQKVNKTSSQPVIKNVSNTLSKPGWKIPNSIDTKEELSKWGEDVSDMNLSKAEIAKYIAAGERFVINGKKYGK